MFDSQSGLERIAANAPAARVYARLDVSNEGASWKLSGKFGAAEKEIMPLMRYSRTLGLEPAGLSFHVGWNNSDTRTWKASVEQCRRIAAKCREAGLDLRFVNIGGGFPAHLVDQEERLRSVAKAIDPVLQKMKSELGLEIYAEPGSFLVANAGVVVSRVLDVIKRGRDRWVYLDTGINQGFHWILGGLEYKIMSADRRESRRRSHCYGRRTRRKCIVAGPTCDGQDIFGKDFKLPSSVKAGAVLLIYPAGAYISSSRAYNGFDIPETKFV